MKRTNNYAFCHGVVKSDSFDHNRESLIVSVNDDSELNRLLRIVFAPDENGVIDGDIGLMMNKKASPEVIQFIKEVLQQDVSNYRTPTIPDGMSDDEVDAYDYHPLQETKSQYAERMREIIYRNQHEIDKARKDSESNEE